MLRLMKNPPVPLARDVDRRVHRKAKRRGYFERADASRRCTRTADVDGLVQNLNDAMRFDGRRVASGGHVEREVEKRVVGTAVLAFWVLDIIIVEVRYDVQGEERFLEFRGKGFMAANRQIAQEGLSRDVRDVVCDHRERP